MKKVLTLSGLLMGLDGYVPVVTYYYVLFTQDISFRIGNDIQTAHLDPSEDHLKRNIHNTTFNNLYLNKHFSTLLDQREEVKAWRKLKLQILLELPKREDPH